VVVTRNGLPGSDDVRAAPPRHADRREALRLLDAVLERGRALTEVAAEAPKYLAPPDRARALSLATETLRRLGQADAVLKRFARRAPPPAARDALRLAAVEVHALGAPAHAAADGAVEATRVRQGGERAAGFVNAVARKLGSDEAIAAWEACDAARTNAPGWLWGRLSSAYGRTATHAICEAHLVRPPLDFSLADKDGPWAAALSAALPEGAVERLPTGGLRLHGRVGQVTSLPGFAEGGWWVQDAAAAAPARLLAPTVGARTLDLCAAPGGKTLQLAAAGADVTAVDLSEQRLERLAENLARTGLSAEMVAADALEWEPAMPFEAILLDAPCSATGTARRHPDVLRRRETPDVKGLAALQDALLDRAWRWLAPGGRLVFATCSLLPEEGEHRGAAFLARTPSAHAPEIDLDALGLPPEAAPSTGPGLRLRPDLWSERGGCDGFYAALFLKEA